MNGNTIRLHPDYRFENDQWFNITEETRMQLTNMKRDYQSQNLQCTDAGSGTNYQCKQQRQVKQRYSYEQPVPENIIKLPPQPHGSIPLPPPPIQSEIYQTSQQTHADDFITMTNGDRGASIMGGLNKQASLISRNTNVRNISSMRTHRRVSRTKAVTDPAPNTNGSN